MARFRGAHPIDELVNVLGIALASVDRNARTRITLEPPTPKT